jgi:hypothetical protein
VLSRGRSLVVDIGVILTWTFMVPPLVVLALLPWRRLLPTERALLLMGAGLVMAVLTVAAELWRRRGDRATQRLSGEFRMNADHAKHLAAHQAFVRRHRLHPVTYEPMTDEQWRELERICR